MSIRAKVILLCTASAIVLGMAGCTLLMDSARDQQAHRVTELAPQLTEKLKDLRHLLVRKGTMKATIHLGTDEEWTVEEAYDYPANAKAIRTLLAQLATARRKEAKTADPIRYTRLGLDDEGAVQLTLQNDARTSLLTVWIGKQNERRDGTYIRVGDDPQTWLVSEPMTPPLTLADWLAQPALSIPSQHVASVSIRHRDGSSLTARRPSPDAPLQLDGGEKGDPMKLARLAAALEQLDFDQVLPKSEFEPKDTALATARFTRFEGGDVIVQPVLHHGRYWLLLEAPSPAKDTDTPLFLPASDVSHWAYRVAEEQGKWFASRLTDLR